MSKVLDENHPEAIEQIINCLKSGRTFVYPTDTIYGFGCDALKPTACEIIRNIKHIICGS